MNVIPWAKKQLLVILGLTIGFWIPALIMLYNPDLDTSIQISLNQARTNAGLMLFFLDLSKYGFSGLFVVILVILLTAIKRSQFNDLQYIFVVWIVAIVLAFLSSEILKFVFTRPRPFETLGSLINTQVTDTGYAFPSGHTTTIFGLILPFSFLFPAKSIQSKIIQIILILFGIILSFSRIFIGLHYVSDILSGIGLSILCTGVAVLIFNWVLKAKIVDLERLDKEIKAVIIIAFIIGPILFLCHIMK